MNRWSAAAVVAGLIVLAIVVQQTNLDEVGRHLRRLSIFEIAILVAVYFLGRLGGVVSWLLTMPVPAFSFWFFRLLRVHMVGGAVERVTPLAGMGGEPVKAVMLKRDYGLGLRDATASLALTRMTDLAAIILFCVLGMVIAATEELRSLTLGRSAILGISFLALSAVSAAVAQRYRLLSRLLPRLANRWPTRFGGRRRFQSLVSPVVDVESRMLRAYMERPGRMALSVASTFVEWLLEACLVYLSLAFLDAPVTVAAAISIAAFALVVRSAFFFVPADIGTQEAALVGICEAFGSTFALGLALAALIRFCELLWTLCGVALGMRYVFGGGKPRLGKRSL